MSDEPVTPEHTAARIEHVLADIEALRLEMGRARDARVPMQVRHAAPREVFYFAQTVHRKANQLCVELGAASVEAPRAGRQGRAEPADVLLVLDCVRERLAVARRQLQLEGDTVETDIPGPLQPLAGKTPSDTMYGCLVASRQINTMLATAFVSRDGNGILMRSIAIAEALLRMHGAELPAPPPFERRKSPRDVFQVLWETCQTFYRTLLSWGVKVVEVNRGFVGEDPTDVFDLATLPLAELEFVASHFPELGPVRAPEPPPSPVLPAHNFQRARQLQAAVAALTQAVRMRPDWLRENRAS
jgi:hypothetical protein